MLVVAHDRPYAELLFERAVKLDAKGFEPDHIESGVWIYQQIIVAYWQIGDFQSAEHWSLRAMRGFPDHFLPYYYLGLTKLRAGHPEQAIPWLEEALRRNQSEPGIEKALDEALAAVER